MAFPDSLQVKVVDRKSPIWRRYHHAWDLLHWMYVGGVEIEANAEQFLKKRPKEPSDVFQQRVEQFSYENHMGEAIDYYQSALFDTPPRIEQALPEGSMGALDLLPDDVEFYDAFSKNCDGAGTPFLEVARERFRHKLLYGRSATLVDLPRGQDFPTLAAQKAAGALDPRVINWDPRQVLNLGRDESGDLNWITLYAREESDDDPFAAAPGWRDRWYHFNRQEFAVYEYAVKTDDNGLPMKIPDDAIAARVNAGKHSLSAQNMVPVLYSECPEGLWFGNRAYLVAKKHLNVSNSLDWSLFMSALAMPVIKMDGDFKLTLAETGVIKLPKDAEYSWAEPEGKSWAVLAERDAALKEEIFRAFYLIAQARTISRTASAQSGASKEQDYAASKKILNMFGQVERQELQRLYDMVSDARGDGLSWDVRGLDFPQDPPNETLDTVATAQAIDVPSDSFEKEMFKRTVVTVLPDMNDALKAKIFKEIDDAPSAVERQQQQMQAQAQQLVGQRLDREDFHGVG